jgi:hypothetical protein
VITEFLNEFMGEDRIFSDKEIDENEFKKIGGKNW